MSVELIIGVVVGLAIVFRWVRMTNDIRAIREGIALLVDTRTTPSAPPSARGTFEPKPLR